MLSVVVDRLQRRVQRGRIAEAAPPQADVEALAAHMQALLDPALRERMGANARTAVEPLTPEAMTLQLVLLYRELLADSPYFALGWYNLALLQLGVVTVARKRDWWWAGLAVLGGGALVLAALAGNELLSLQKASRRA